MRSFRTYLALSGAVTLAACGGDTGPQTVGGVAPPAASPTPTHSFVAPTDPKTYDGIGTVQHYGYYTDSNKSGQGGQLYAGDANTARNGGITVNYNPRDAVFELTINRPAGDVSTGVLRYQDPLHRTAFGGPATPQAGVPEFDAARNIQYLEAGSQSGSRVGPGSQFYTYTDPATGQVVTTAANSTLPVMADQSSYNVATLFYQKPGTTTKYVTYAGFVRNTVSGSLQQPDPSQPAFLRQTYSLDRAAFVFGERSANSAVPTTGTGTFNGEMIASMVVNVDPTTRLDATLPSYLQWIQGTQSTSINFANLSVSTHFEGTVMAPGLDAYTNAQYPLAAGTLFDATASAMIDMVNRGGFTGQFSQACFAADCTAANSLVIAGSSLDGTFYGPNADEIGGGFRIVGGTPDQRIDILGAFVGKKP
ncbi:MAG: transferrin-binding protein-like solute binding protein [Sphingomonas sp.]|uniref:transferrin-binding protein-like solute binding protein n=1 Tax=Sphingomonas sp. TaxID=28214 RepID=UPI0022725D51|nr:transferrin-binding protein-like solute binding protein [Sphingomonas sp.]MCX8474829.1 transferrin-binding protein-like solute binding protein [Sphingomonas sp.]